MSISSLENLLINSAFATLFMTTFYYWGQFSFFAPLSPVFEGPTRSSSYSSEEEAVKEQKTGPLNFLLVDSLGNLGFLLANSQLLSFLVLRWFESRHFPLSNLYESLIFLAWSLTMSHFVLQTKTNSQVFLGSITAPSALFIEAFASLILPDALKEASPLVPALQSNWLMMHVTMMILSYSMLILGSLLAIAFLILSSPQETKASISKLGNGAVETVATEDQEKGGQAQKTLCRFLDNLSYRTLGFGFPLLTIGILSGAVWANQAWGSYWSWDPKETWALITWIVFAIYFHFRLNQKWSGQKPAIIASIGFVFLWVCYLGVNLLGKGLHSYGWF